MLGKDFRIKVSTLINWDICSVASREIYKFIYLPNDREYRQNHIWRLTIKVISNLFYRLLRRKWRGKPVIFFHIQKTFTTKPVDDIDRNWNIFFFVGFTLKKEDYLMISAETSHEPNRCSSYWSSKLRSWTFSLLSRCFYVAFMVKRETPEFLDMREISGHSAWILLVAFIFLARPLFYSGCEQVKNK